MSEMTSPAYANTLKVFTRNAAIGVGATALALLAPEQTYDALPIVPHETQIETSPIDVLEAEDTVFKPSSSVQPTQLFSRAPSASRTRTQTVPKLECWNGKPSELSHTHAAALGNIALACQLATNEAWYKESPKKEITCLAYLWDRESGWNPQSHNASSGAHGIPQALPGNKMQSVGSNWRTSASTQIKWGFGYIDARYGSPCAALNSWNKKGWY